MGRRTPTGNWNGKCCWPVFAAQSPPISEGLVFFLDATVDGGIPAGLSWAGRASVATYVDEAGLVQTAEVDVLRDADYSRGARRILLEPAATNLYQYSNDFSNAVWSKSNCFITTNAIAGPDGKTTAGKLVENTASSARSLRSTISETTAGRFVYSVFIKSAGEGRYLQFMGGGLQGANEAPVFNPDTGAVDQGATNNLCIKAWMEPYADGWYRCCAELEHPGTSSVGFGLTNSATNNGTPSYVGDGSSGFYVAMAQRESGSTLTSYIDTLSTADTRAADAPLSWPLTTPQAEGMVIFEGEYVAAGTGGLIGFRTGGAEGPLYKATDTAQACSDSAGTINAGVAAHAADKSLVFAARWSTDEGDKECLNQSSGAWVSASGTKGVWTTDAAVVIGHSITAPLFINTASVYDEDRGRDFIEGNWS